MGGFKAINITTKNIEKELYVRRYYVKEVLSGSAYTFIVRAI